MPRRSRSYKTRMANLRGDGTATKRRKEEQSQALSSLHSSQENPFTDAQATNSSCNSRRVLNNSNGQRSLSIKKVPQPTTKKSPAQNPQVDQLTLATSKGGHTVTVFRHAHRKYCAPPESNTNSTFGVFAVTENVALSAPELVRLDIANGRVGRGEELEW